MSKFFRKLIPLLFVGFVCSTTFGLSYFYLQEKRSTDSTISNDANNKIKNDDIKENYNFGRESKTYTIYFFPSASYMYLYSQYLTGSTTVKPEEEFGYKEPEYNDDGSFETDSNGNVEYKLSENTGNYQGTDKDGNALNYGDVTYDGAYRRFMGEKFSCSNFEADGGQAYGAYNNASQWPYTTVNNDPYSVVTAYTQSQNSLPSGERRTWGMPSDKESDNFTIFTDDPDRVEHFNGRNQFSCDRLGCWGDDYYYGKTIKDSDDDGAPTGLLYGDSTTKPDGMDNTNTGRYLPIKLTVTNELITSIVDQVVPDVFTSMGTLLRNTSYSYRYMHNYTFTEWTYVKNPDTNPVYPYSPAANTNEYGENTVGEAFQPQPTDTYFDMMTDLDQYADSEGVIRLFPLFSNGKKSSVSSEDKSNYTKGGGSSQKLKITDSNGDIDYKYPFFNTDIYNNGTGNFTYDNNGTSTITSLTSSNIRMFSYNNISITNSESTLEFSANNVDGSPTNWDTSTDKTTSKVSLLWKKLYTLDSTYIQDQLIKNYGEGIYTFYVFVANYSYQDGKTDDIKSTFDAFYKNIVSQASDGKFTSLNGKRLIQVTAIDSEYNETNGGDYRYSPTVVAFEKIDEPKLMATDSQPSDLSSFISNNYSSGSSFYRNVSPLYKGTKNGDTYGIDGDDLSSSSPYTYLIKNVGLGTIYYNYFVIAFNSEITTTTFNTSNSDMEYEYLISDPDDTTNIEEEDVYTAPFGDNGYIDAVTYDNGKVIFKLKNTGFDVYDILIKYNSKNGKYDIYMHKHKLFLYVFDQDLPAVTSGYVDYTYDNNYKTSTGATLLFGKEYSEEEVVSSKDTSSVVSSGNSLEKCIKDKIINDLGTSFDESVYLKYRLIDRVTGEKVAWFEKETDSNGNTTYKLKCNLTMNKNHILYLDKIA